MNDLTLTFASALKYPSNLQGINIDAVLSLSGRSAISISIKLDTGSTFCVFQRRYAELLGINVEDDDPEIIRTATGKFLAFGHEVTLTIAAFEWEATVYFAQDEYFPINVVGRLGFLDRLKIGLIDYEQWLYLSSAFDDPA